MHRSANMFDPDPAVTILQIGTIALPGFIVICEITAFLTRLRNKGRHAATTLLLIWAVLMNRLAWSGLPRSIDRNPSLAVVTIWLFICVELRRGKRSSLRSERIPYSAQRTAFITRGAVQAACYTVSPFITFFATDPPSTRVQDMPNISDGIL